MNEVATFKMEAAQIVELMGDRLEEGTVAVAAVKTNRQMAQLREGGDKAKDQTGGFKRQGTRSVYRNT